MEEWETNIKTEGFGKDCEMKWKIIRSWKSFKKLFKNAQHIDAITYCESPSLLKELFEMDETNLKSINVAVGNKEEYKSAVDDEGLARELVEMYENDKLTVHLKKRKVVHAKMYRIVKGDTVTLVTGSANLSYNSWKNQANQVAVYNCEKNSKFDKKFHSQIKTFRKEYFDHIFLEDLVKDMRKAEDKDEEEKMIELWIDGRDSRLTEQGEIHKKGAKKIQNVADEVIMVTNDDDKAEKKVMIEETDSSNSKDEQERDITAAKTTGKEISLSTQGYDGSYIDNFEDNLKTKGGNVSGNRINTPIETYSNYKIDRYGIPDMYIKEADDKKSVCIQSGKELRDMTAEYEASGDELDECLSNIENYIETVRWGETSNETAVKAHMYEGILYFLWAPFTNKFAEAFYGDATLDKTLPYLYINGPSDAGKDKFTEFCLRLISDELVTSGQDGENIGKKDIRSIRRINTVMPFVVSDIQKKSIKQIDTLRNYWEDRWSPYKETKFPTLVFTSNDSKPSEWFRNRSRMLFFDVVFPSDPEDDGFFEAQKELKQVINTKNNIFSHVSREMFKRKPWNNPSGTVKHVREILLDFYKRAERDVPDYFPERSAAREYDEGRRKWKSAKQRGDLEFEMVGEQLIADFDLESYEVYSYKKTLPKNTRPEKQNNTIVIKSPQRFTDWFDGDIGVVKDDGGLLSRFSLI
jgi:hypothetical protein